MDGGPAAHMEPPECLPSTQATSHHFQPGPRPGCLSVRRCSVSQLNPGEQTRVPHSGLSLGALPSPSDKKFHFPEAPAAQGLVWGQGLLALL